MQNQKNSREPYKPENLQNILLRTLSCEKHSKTINQAQQRQLYSQLLDYSSVELHKNISRIKANGKDLLAGRQFIGLLAGEVVKLAQRQCIEKSSLLSLLFTYYQESLVYMESLLSLKQADLIKEYCTNIEKQRIQYQNKIAGLQGKLADIQKMNDQKWKSFYLVVNDNRVLRRQKGKLMRLLTEQRNKLTKVHEQMIEIAKQNQKNRLLAKYAEQSMSLELYIKNHNSILKLEQFMKAYPTYAKKLLKMDLEKLETLQNTKIDEKIQYILKSVRQQSQIIDEYEDLTDVWDRQLNKLIFNIFTQTCPEDFPQDIELLKKQPNVQAVVKMQTKHRGTQANSFGKIKLQSNVLKIQDAYRHTAPRNQRRRAVKMDTIQNGKMMEIVKKYMDNHQIKRVFNIKLAVQDSRNLRFEIDNVMSIAINFSIVNDYPQLPTNYRLKNDMRRGRKISRRDFSTKKLSNFLSSGMKNFSQEQGRLSNRLMTEQPQFITKREESQRKSVNSIKIKYMSNSSKAQIEEESKQNEKLINNLTDQTIEAEQNKQQICFESESGARLIKKLTKRKKESLKQLMQKNPRISIKIQKQNATVPEIRQSSKKQLLTVNKEETREKHRKSGFKIERNSKSKVVTEPDEQSLKEEQEDEIIFDNLRTLQKTKTQRTNKLQNSMVSKRMSYQVSKISRFSRESQIKQQNMPRSSQIKHKQKVIDFKDVKIQSKGRIKKVVAQQKIINIMSPQFLKLADKIVRSIYSRRREISQGKVMFQQFLKSFMVTQYGFHLQLIFVTRSTKTKTNAVLYIFDLLLNSHQSQFYLQYIFRMFAKIITLNGGDGLDVNEERGRQIFKQTMKVYTNEQLIEQNVKSFYEFGYQGNFTNLVNNFIYIQKYLREQLKQSELYHFLQILLPKSQLTLNYEEVREIFGLFQFENDYHQQLFAVKQMAQPEINIYNLCFLASRQQWSPLFHIKQYIASQYQKLFGQFDQYAYKEYISSFKAPKYDWIMRIVEQNLKYGLYEKAEDKVLLIKYISLLLMIHYIERQLPLSEQLSELTKQYSIITIKQKPYNLQF